MVSPPVLADPITGPAAPLMVASEATTGSVAPRVAMVVLLQKPTTVPTLSRGLLFAVILAFETSPLPPVMACISFQLFPASAARPAPAMPPATLALPEATMLPSKLQLLMSLCERMPQIPPMYASFVLMPVLIAVPLTLQSVIAPWT